MPINIIAADDPVLNKKNLDKVKRHIITNGYRCTYVNKYNNNPCWAVSEFQFYLNPDPGPDGHQQWNFNCDITRGDFNTLVVYVKSSSDGWRAIEFLPGKAVAIRVLDGASPSDLVRAKDLIRNAVNSALEAIKGAEKIPERQ